MSPRLSPLLRRWVASGDGVYSVNVMVDGQRIHRVLGKESEGVTRTQAEQYIEKVHRCLP